MLFVSTLNNVFDLLYVSMFAIYNGVSGIYSATTIVLKVRGTFPSKGFKCPLFQDFASSLLHTSCMSKKQMHLTRIFACVSVNTLKRCRKINLKIEYNFNLLISRKFL